MTAHELPESARLAWWLTAWLRGYAGADDLIDEVLAGDAAHHVADLPDQGDELVPLVLALGAVRSLGATSAGLAFPVYGDPVGLGGPAAFNTEALEAGQAVVLPEAGAGLVPVRAGAGVVWRWMPAQRRQVPDLGEADRGLRAALPQAANALAALDVARWRPEVADELSNLHHRPALEPPTGTPPLCADLAGRALQAMAIVDLALADDGGAVTAMEADARRTALTGLEGAARRALVASCSPEGWPPA